MSKQSNSILLTGSSGQLGQAIVSSGLFRGLLTPSRKELDIAKELSVLDYFEKNNFCAVIHAAALARMALCEKDPAQAINVNILGSINLVKAVLKKELTSQQKIYFMYISTDGVYPGTEGHYKETDPTVPYNKYGWTKLAGECAVHLLSQFCIVRTRFFVPKNLKFDSCATDSYTSSLPVADFVKALATLCKKRFMGIINIGGNRVSDFERMKSIKPNIRPCLIDDILKDTPFLLSRDASLDTALWRQIEQADNGPG